MSDKSQKVKGTFVPRIIQLDAYEFDKEITNVLFDQLMNVSKYLKPGALDGLKHEFNLVLKLLIFYYSVVKKNATFGQQLLSVKYATLLTKNQVVIYMLINFLLPYLKNKYENHSSRVQNIVVRNTVDKIELFSKMCKILNDLIFIRQGKYPSIIDRLLKLEYSPVGKLNPAVGYNYMSRELLWHGFMELLMYFVPLVNYKALKRKVKKLLAKSEEIKCKKSIIYNSDTKCIVCDDFPVLPCQISIYCPHLACYYCIKSNLLADKKFMCPVCGENNTVYEQLVYLSE